MTDMKEKDNLEEYFDKMIKYSSLISFYKEKIKNSSSPYNSHTNEKLIAILEHKIKDVEHLILLDNYNEKEYKGINILEKVSISEKESSDGINYMLNYPLNRNIGANLAGIKLLFNFEHFEKIDQIIEHQPYNKEEITRLLNLREMDREFIYVNMKKINYLQKLYNNEKEFDDDLLYFYTMNIYSFFIYQKANVDVEIPESTLEVMSYIINKFNLINKDDTMLKLGYAKGSDECLRYEKFISYYRLNKTLNNYQVKKEVVKI